MGKYTFPIPVGVAYQLDARHTNQYKINILITVYLYSIVFEFIVIALLECIAAYSIIITMSS